MKSIITTKRIFFGIIAAAIFVLASACGESSAEVTGERKESSNTSVLTEVDEYTGTIRTVTHDGVRCFVYKDYKAGGLSCDWDGDGVG